MTKAIDDDDDDDTVNKVQRVVFSKYLFQDTIKLVVKTFFYCKIRLSELLRSVESFLLFHDPIYRIFFFKWLLISDEDQNGRKSRCAGSYNCR